MIRTNRPVAAAHQRTRLVGGLLVALLGFLTWGCGTGAETSQPPGIEIDRPQVEQPATEDAEQESAEDAERSEAEPAVAEPVAVEASAADIDTSLVPVGLQPDGAMELPDPGTGAWYDLGPRPGEPGPAVLIGHVDSVAGPDVFFGLSTLGDGDVVHVDDATGVRRAFVVTGVETVRKDDLPYERIWAEVEEPVLRLITCGGSYERDNGGYQENVVVYAVMQGETPAG